MKKNINELDIKELLLNKFRLQGGKLRKKFMNVSKDVKQLKIETFSFYRVVFWKMPPLCAIPGHRGIT